MALNVPNGALPLEGTTGHLVAVAGADGSMAPTGVPADEVVTGDGITRVVAISQTGYDELPTPRPSDVLYVVTG